MTVDKKMDFTPSAQQLAACDEFKSGNSFALIARAGSGKTSTLKLMAKDYTSEGIAVAFGKANALELNERLPDTIKGKSLNGIGHGALMKMLNSPHFKVDKNKLFHLLRNYTHISKLDEDSQKTIVSIVKLAKIHGITSGFGGRGRPNIEEWLELCHENDIIDPEPLMEHAVWLLFASTEAAFSGYIDFDDQIYVSVLHKAPFRKYGLVLVDEAQDLSKLQHEMISKTLANQGQLVLVGDDRQAIFAFRGADQNSFRTLQNRFNLPSLPLSKSFRCPRSVIREAQRYVPDIEAAGDEEGLVTHSSEYPKPEKHRTVIARYNAPLLALAFAALKNRVPVNYLGRDFMGGLRALHKRHPTRDSLEKWFLGELAVAKDEIAAQRVEDRYACMIILHEESERIHLPIEKVVQALSEDPKDWSFTLSTIHKSKGLEFNHLTYLNSNKPLKEPQGDNLHYVAITRAKQTLTLHEAPLKIPSFP